MKPYTHAIYIAALLALGVIYFIEQRTNQDNTKALQSEIKAAKRENRQQYDSLMENYKLRGDSLEVAFNTIKIVSFERQQAFERTQRIIKNYEKILFVSFGSDSASSRELSKLYPSYKHP